MPPSRRPPRASGSNKKPPLADFSSPSSLLTTLPSPSVSSLLSEASQQESQSIRYISGSKAIRHLNNALCCYRSIHELSEANEEEKVEAKAEEGRVLFTLASEHTPSPACVSLVEEAIAALRTAHGRAGKEETRDDIGYSLAIALLEWAGMIEEGASPSRDTGVEEAEREAWDLLREVATSQISKLETLATLSAGEGEEEETSSTTPSATIDTLLALLELGFDSLPSSSSSTLEPPVQDAINILVAAFDQAGSLVPFLPPEEIEESTLSLSLLSLSFSASLLPFAATSLPSSINSFLLSKETIISRYETLLSQPTHKTSLPLLTQFGDYLHSLSLSSSLPIDSRIQALSKGKEAFESALKLLGDPFKRPEGVNAVDIPRIKLQTLASLSRVLDDLGAREQGITLLREVLSITIKDGRMSVVVEKKEEKTWSQQKAVREAFLVFLHLHRGLPLQGVQEVHGALLPGRNLEEDAKRWIAEQVEERGPLSFEEAQWWQAVLSSS